MLHTDALALNPVDIYAEVKDSFRSSFLVEHALHIRQQIDRTVRAYMKDPDAARDSYFVARSVQESQRTTASSPESRKSAHETGLILHAIFRACERRIVKLDI